MADFEKDGVVSIWAFLHEEKPGDEGKDVLQEFCGVDYYDRDYQEVVPSSQPCELRPLLEQISYADSFIDEVVTAAQTQGVAKCYGVIAQYNFAYAPSLIESPISVDPLFVGVFDWSES